MASPQGLAPSTRTLLFLSAAVIVLAGVHAARELVGPLVLGAVIVIICHPVRHPLERRGWPRWAATTAVIVVAYLILASLALLVFAGIQFARLVGDYATSCRTPAQRPIVARVARPRPGGDAAASVLEPSNILAFASSLGGTVLGVLTAFFFVLAYVIFMAADGARYPRAEQAFGAACCRRVRRFSTFNSSVRRYYVVNASFGAVVAIIDGLALWALGVPAPAVWAILAFVTNFIPNIGFVIGLDPARAARARRRRLAAHARRRRDLLRRQRHAAGARAAEVRERRREPQPHAELLLGHLLDVHHRPARRDPRRSRSRCSSRALVLEGGPETAWYSWLSGEDRPKPAVDAPDPEPAAVEEPATD